MENPAYAIRCADGGVCMRKCRPGPCFRVQQAGPLTGVFPGDGWPEEVRQAEDRLGQGSGLGILGLPITADQDDPVRKVHPISGYAVIKGVDPETGSFGYFTVLSTDLNLVEALGMNQFAGMRMVHVLGMHLGE